MGTFICSGRMSSGCLRALFLQDEVHHLCDFVKEMISESRSDVCVTSAARNLRLSLQVQPVNKMLTCRGAFVQNDSVKKHLLERHRVTDLGCGFGDGDAFRSAKAHCWWTVKAITHHKKGEVCCGVFYPGLWFEAARWLWSLCMRRSSLQVKQCQRGPRRSSSCWASLAEGGFAREETRIGQKISRSKQKELLQMQLTWLRTWRFSLCLCYNRKK